MRFLLVVIFIFSFSLFKAGATDDSIAKKNDTLKVYNAFNSSHYCKSVVGIFNPANNCNENYIFDRSLYEYQVDTLAQVRFWRNIMNLHQDTAIICFADTREEIEKVCVNEWNCRTESQKKLYRDSIRCARNLDSNSRILLTTGKKFFYDFDRTSQNFHRGINCFISNDVDPWYAQAILLIESPNKLQKSHVGAYGPFQLMKDVARMYGLKVNKYVDERANFERSAFAASSLIKYICIPQAHKMLDSMNIKGFTEDELWFRLFVMHIYHAGAFNVQKALYAIQPGEGNMDLIYTLWRTQTARFKSASQNYSQLVLAAMLEMNQRNNALARLSPPGN